MARHPSHRESIEASFDAIVVGSGFGGSVAALRMTQKGYRVLVIEKGGRFRAKDFAKSSWNVPRWLWAPHIGFRGPFQMRFFRHVTAATGIGVGGGSLVYANTLPTPQGAFFESGSWAGIRDWKQELKPFYWRARRMLGASDNAVLNRSDLELRRIAEEDGRLAYFAPTRIGVFQGEPGVTVPDPYFDGEGPTRTGCIRCGACMIGCRFNAKNTLDKNYLWLAERRGARVLADSRVTAIRPHSRGGYRVEVRAGAGLLREGQRPRWRAFHASRVFLAAGVLGTTELLLRMQEDPRGLSLLSERVGYGVRTNAESLMAITSASPALDHSKGIAIGAIYHTSGDSHVELCRYPGGSGAFRLLVIPHAPGRTLAARIGETLRRVVRRPIRYLKVLGVRDWARSTEILLYMRTSEGTLRFMLGRDVFTGGGRGLVSALDTGEPPATFMPEATAIAERLGIAIGGEAMSVLTETVLGTPTTAHILGGAVIGADPGSGVIDADHRVYGYDGLYVVDGAAISANPGVNPALSITAMAERALDRIPSRANPRF